MHRLYKKLLAFVLIVTVLVSGCAPQQPFFLNEDGDLSHLLTEQLTMDYPDVDSPKMPQATQTMEPRSLLNDDPGEFWNLTLEETISMALHNSKIIRSVGQVRQFRQVGQGASTPPESLAINGDFASSVYDVAIQETGQGGTAAALSQFDAQWATNVFWDKTDRPQNVTEGTGTQVFARHLIRNNVNFQSELTKRSARGTQFQFRNVTTYDDNNRPLRVQASEWLTSFEAEMRHPLMRGGGTQVNRIPLTLARIRTDVSMIDFMASVRGLLSEVEKSYWELYFFYRNFEAAKVGRDSALLTWRRINALYEEGAEQGDAASRAQAQEQYFFFRGRVEEAKRDLLKAERQLRYLMGIEATDGRIIRPVDEPTTARVNFDWNDVLMETLTGTGEIRRQKWRIKEQELSLVAAKNNLLPQLDAVALYRWLGLGDDLASADRRGVGFPFSGSTAFEDLTGGDSQEWRMGVEFNVPIGFRAELSEVRNRQLQLAREKAKLEELELELSHSLTDAVQNLDASYQLMTTASLQGLSARQQVDALQAQLDSGTVTLDFLLDAQRRLADAKVAFYQSLIQYNFSIVEVHFRKGSLLEYCGVMLQEGPWAAKAYFDAKRLARQRDASYYFNYGYSRPGVISKGTPSNGAVPAEVMMEPNAMEFNAAGETGSSINVVNPFHGETMPAVPSSTVPNGMPTEMSIPMEAVPSMPQPMEVMPGPIPAEIIDPVSSTGKMDSAVKAASSTTAEKPATGEATSGKQFQWGNLGFEN